MKKNLNVQTVTGEIPPESLGKTLTHEHIFNCDPAFAQTFGKIWIDKPAVEARAIAQLSCLKTHFGYRTFVDPTPISLGRDVEMLRRISLASGMQIIAATGVYYTELPGFGNKNPETLAELFAAECRNGVDGTDIRPGILKCASNAPALSPQNAVMLTAMAITQKMTGLPLMAHSEVKNRTADYQTELFLKCGADPAKTVIAHMGENGADYNSLRRILDLGFWIGIDRFGAHYGKEDLTRRCKLVARLIADGYEKQLLLSHDALIFIDFGDGLFADKFAEKLAPSHTPYAFWDTTGKEILQAEGVNEKTFLSLMTENPKHLFS